MTELAGELQNTSVDALTRYFNAIYAKRDEIEIAELSHFALNVLEYSDAVQANDIKRGGALYPAVLRIAKIALPTTIRNVVFSRARDNALIDGLTKAEWIAFAKFHLSKLQHRLHMRQKGRVKRGEPDECKHCGQVIPPGWKKPARPRRAGLEGRLAGR